MPGGDTHTRRGHGTHERTHTTRRVAVPLCPALSPGKGDVGEGRGKERGGDVCGGV